MVRRGIVNDGRDGGSGGKQQRASSGGEQPRGRR
jgi:hypothetical protein